MQRSIRPLPQSACGWRHAHWPKRDWCTLTEHCSARIAPGQFLVSPPKPLGMVNGTDRPVVVATSGELPAGALPEVIAHQHIYRLRDDVVGIVRFQSPHLMALSALGRLHACCTDSGPTLRLVRHCILTRAWCAMMQAPRRWPIAWAVRMPSSCAGNGAITAGASVEEAVALAWYLEDAARVELAVLSTGIEPQAYSAEEVRDRAIDRGPMLLRMWNWMSANDPER